MVLVLGQGNCGGYDIYYYTAIVVAIIILLLQYLPLGVAGHWPIVAQLLNYPLRRTGMESHLHSPNLEKKEQQ